MKKQVKSFTIWFLKEKTESSNFLAQDWSLAPVWGKQERMGKGYLIDSIVLIQYKELRIDTISQFYGIRHCLAPDWGCNKVK